MNKNINCSKLDGRIEKRDIKKGTGNKITLHYSVVFLSIMSFGEKWFNF